MADALNDGAFPDFRHQIRDLRSLETAWAKAYPKRAMGGLVSIAGFGYQFHSTLRDAVEAWIENSTNLTPLFEALSDVAQACSGGWKITQVKTSGTSTSLRRALDELWTIDVVAREQTPSLVPLIQYEVRAARWQLRDARGALERWVPEERTEDPNALEAFRPRVFISCDPHPLDDLVVVLTNRLHMQDPLGWVNRWVGKLVEAAHDGLNPHHTARELYADLASLSSVAPQNQLPPGIHLLESDLCEPEVVEQGPYLVGEQPRLVHLREGCFAPREWQVIPATEAFLKWLSADPFGVDRNHRIPIFWVGGRSGSGKSVLLLQLLARLVGHGLGPILWIANRRHLLPDAMKWAVKAVDQNFRPILALDDPLAPGEQGDAALHWQRAIDHVEVARDEREVAPILLACGPTEQARALAYDFGNDLQVEVWSLDESRDEDYIDDLLGWFVARTGEPPPALGRGDVLMIQRFFEWRTGEALWDFAKRFRSRIQALNPSGVLNQLITELLAVNRLYAGLPNDVLRVLDDRDQDALGVLRQDHHIAVNAQEGRPGIWLAHPHLADALFRGWFRADQGYQRAGALRDGILTCLTHGASPAEQTAPLWAYFRALTAEEDDPVSERIDPEADGRALEQAHAAWIEETGLSFAHLPIWLRLSILLPGLGLAPPPLEHAMRQLAPERANETGFRLTCHVLISHLHDLTSEDREIVIERIRLILDELPAWREWPHVAIDLAQNTKSAEDGDRLISWISANRMSRMVPVALRAALDISATETRAREIALAFAPRAPGEAAWARLFELLIGNEDAIQPVAVWARAHSAEPRSTFVLRGLLLQDHPEAPELARRWLGEYNTSPVANYLIEPLIEREGSGEFEIRAAENWLDAAYAGSDRLIEWLLQTRPTAKLIYDSFHWLDRHPDAAGWAHVFQKLFKVVQDPQQRVELIGRGFSWLEGREERSNWAHVLQNLLDVVRDEEQRRQLVDRGFAWLSGNEERPEWSYVVQNLLDVVRDDEQRRQLVDRSFAWLSGNEERPEWNYVFRKLLDVVRDDEQRRQLVDRGFAWLDGNEERSEWTHVLRKLVDMVRDDEQQGWLVNRGFAWLDGNEERPEWAFVLQKLLKVVRDHEQRLQLVDRGFAWLDGNEERPEWAFVLQRLLDVVRDDEQRRQLVDRGFAWLDGNEERSEWTHVLRKLVDVVRDDEQQGRLVNRGFAWLDGNEERTEWAFVLQKLLNVVRDHEQRRQLVDRGFAWLNGNEERPEWTHVLQKLLDVVWDDEQRRQLVDRGFAWLDGRDERPAWNYVLQKLLKATRDDEEQAVLVERASSWLASHPNHPGAVHVRSAIAARQAGQGLTPEQ